MTIASAPGRVFIFGEHAVLYGQPALAAAIDIRAKVQVNQRQDNQVRIESKGIGKLVGAISRSSRGWRIDVLRGKSKELAYVVKAIELTFDELGMANGLDVNITSDIPPGSGLSSSSAVAVATVAATAAALGRGFHFDDILELAFRTELSVQGAASITNVAASLYGGFVKISGGRVERLRNMPTLPLIIGNTNTHSNTAILIRKVKELREKHPVVIDSIFEAIGCITKAGVEAIEQQDFERVGRLMDINQTLLSALGVSSPQLERSILVARRTGALGAKLTGAGGGGSIIVLASKKQREIARTISGAGGNPILTAIGCDGLKVEGH